MTDDRGGGGGGIQLLIPPPVDPERLRADASLEIRSFGGETMGTSWSVSAALPSGASVEPLRALLETGFASIVAQVSQWEPTSELSRYNAAPGDSWHHISPQFAMVIEAALALQHASGGAFNPAIGRASEAWGFGVSDMWGEPPDAAGLAPRAGLRFDKAGRRLYQPGGVMLDLSGIAKGFAVDHALAGLRAAGIAHALVEIGGELAASGVRPDGQPWWVDVEPPPGSDAPPARIALSNWAVATSGHYLRRRQVAGKSWSHSIDPATGRPIDDDTVSVTVLHPRCCQADGLATAIAVLGSERGMVFADRHRIAARIVTADATICSTAWLRYCE